MAPSSANLPDSHTNTIVRGKRPLSPHGVDQRHSKQPKMDEAERQKYIDANANAATVEDYRMTKDNRMKGVARIKPEFLLLYPEAGRVPLQSQIDDDAAEGKTFNSSGIKSSFGSRKPAKGNHAHDDERDADGGVQEARNDRPFDDEFEQAPVQPRDQNAQNDKKTPQWKKNDKKPKKETGQNKNRQFGTWSDKIKLCSSRQFVNEFTANECQHGEKCKYEHDLRKYLAEGKLDDIQVDAFKVCPVFEEQGFCPVGWQCRFVKTHSREVEREDGRSELVLIRDEDRMRAINFDETTKAVGAKVYNVINVKDRIDLERNRVDFSRSNKYSDWLTNTYNQQQFKAYNAQKGPTGHISSFKGHQNNGEKPAMQLDVTMSNGVEAIKEDVQVLRSGQEHKSEMPVQSKQNGSEINQGMKLSPTGGEFAPSEESTQARSTEGGVESSASAKEFAPSDGLREEEKRKTQNFTRSVNSTRDAAASYKEPPFRASEKRRLYFGPETPVLAPLTTQGNLPFRRLCVELGAQVTWGEMAMSLPLLQGKKPEWALVKSHETEMSPPTVSSVVQDYDNSRDMKFGVQIAASKPWQAFKATEALAKFTPRIRAIDFNCGCPIDMVFNSGGGSALLDAAPKLEKILRGMNALSGEIPIQVKVRMGVKDNHPTAGALASRLILGGESAQADGLGPCGIAAMTLHGRSRQQRYAKLANWTYIAEVAALIKDIQEKQDLVIDTVREADPRDQANGGKVYFIGNGDVYSPEEYYEHIHDAGVDSIMVARGALIKPWIFEEIETGQALDKSSSERLRYIEKFCRYGLDTWGSDEMGVGLTRKFLLEWLSFTHRYIPLGLLEVLPPMINERPPPYKGRDELETLLSSENYQDWIKISEMFLGPAHKGFKFTPKHKSNAYEAEATVQG